MCSRFVRGLEVPKQAAPDGHPQGAPLGPLCSSPQSSYTPRLTVASHADRDRLLEAYKSAHRLEGVDVLEFLQGSAGPKRTAPRRHRSVPSPGPSVLVVSPQSPYTPRLPMPSHAEHDRLLEVY